ncbi:MAG: hypothetical protein KDC76_07340 [Bacteroidetes bacterium]|nr:hypothetical protein [Bacteroidota bacterium]
MKKVYLVAILVTLVLMVTLSIRGFNSKSSSPADPSTDQQEVEPARSEDELLHILRDPSFAQKNPVSQLQVFKELESSGQLTDEEKVAAARLKIELASSNEDVMGGVRSLLSIIQQDSNNIPALETLAELAIQSGQLEKARERYQKLLTLQPQNQVYREQLDMLDGRLQSDNQVVPENEKN